MPSFNVLFEPALSHRDFFSRPLVDLSRVFSSRLTLNPLIQSITPAHLFLASDNAVSSFEDFLLRLSSPLMMVSFFPPPVFL